MPFWTYQNLAVITAGQWLVPPADEIATLPAAERATGPILWHDSREIAPGQCYLALTGENFDGHDFVEQAFTQGAALAIVQSEAAVSAQLSAFSQRQQPILRVENSEKALQQLARAYRKELGAKTSGAGGCTVIGIAGSNGKTTTRHLIHHVLTHAGLRGTQSPKSFNNHLGVPLTLLSARPTDDFVACEIGTNHPGEIDFLAEIVKPDIAVITSIGEEHLEFFGDLEGVIKEEFSIANYFTDQTLCIAPNEVPWVDSKIEAAYLRAEPLHEIAKPLAEQLDRFHEPTRLCGMLAACVALQMKVDESSISNAFRSAPKAPGRWEKIHLCDNVTVIHDAYNANPTSTLAALHAICQTRCSRRIFVFGDMFELGETAPWHHKSVGRLVGGMPFDLFVTIGQLARFSHEEAQADVVCVHFDQWNERLPGEVADLLKPGDTVLLKASRGMRLERLIPAIELRFGRAE